jgi:hypothetical protein
LHSSIPYERFNSNGNSTSFEPQLINDDQDDSSSSDSSRCSTPESEHLKLPRLISLDNNDDGDVRYKISLDFRLSNPSFF